MRRRNAKVRETITLSREEFEAHCRLLAMARVYLDSCPEGDTVPTLAQARFEAALRAVEGYYK